MNFYRRADRPKRAMRRLGYTLLEIMTSVTLALMLMYAVARIFSRVGGQMNETMSTMEMSNALRNAKNRLTADLESLSASPQPPRNSRMNDGYLCYIEGMGGPIPVVGAGNGFSTADIALDTERCEQYNLDPDFVSDNTVGDTDDILCFTAKAPEGQPFRGRYVKPVHKVNASGNQYLKGELAVYESQYAEIIWFCRGTTLYRRVLPIMPDNLLQESFDALFAKGNSNDKGDPNDPTDIPYHIGIRQGFGFYSLYDISVHLDSNGNVVANTLGDLTNRANRYFFWNSVGLNRKIFSDPNGNQFSKKVFPLAMNGFNSAWYWLRMPTLQESAYEGFRAGAPFGDDSQCGVPLIPFLGISSVWQGFSQTLTYINNEPIRPLQGSFSCAQLPQAGRPFIDFWNNPNVWVDDVNLETGDLVGTASPDGPYYNQDVVLQNVISFNVRIWDPNTNAYIDLGGNYDKLSGSDRFDPDNFGSRGYYGADVQNAPDGALEKAWIPCVYDTWSEQYQRDLFDYDDANGTSYANGSILDVLADGNLSSSSLQDFPPPYNGRCNSLQIELRVFDPRSKHIRNATFNVDLSTL